MYKIITGILLFSILSNNIVLANNINTNSIDINKSVILTDNNSYYNEREKQLIDGLIKKQTAKEAEVELKLFKLQKSIISNIENKYNDLINNYKLDLEALKNLYIKNYKTESNVNLDMKLLSNNTTKKFIPNIADNTNIFGIKTDINTTYEKSKDINKSNFNGNIELTILQNKLNSKFDLQNYYNNGKLILNLNKLNFKTKFQYDNSLKIINPNLTEEEFKKFTNEIDAYLNKINKNSLFLKGKTIEISNYKDVGVKQGNLNLNMLYNSIEKLSPSQISKILEILKSEHIFIVYNTIGNNKYSILYNNDISIKINNIIGKQVLPIIKYSDIKELESSKSNIIEELNNGNFKYQKIKKELVKKEGVDKKVKEITEALYLEFNSDKIYTFLLKNSNQILFFNKNILQVKIDDLLGYFMFNSKDLMGKLMFKGKAGDIIEIIYYLKDKFEAGIIDFKIKDRLNKSITGKGGIKYIKIPKTNEYKINGNIDISGKIIKSDNSELNKNGSFKLKGEYIFSKTNVKSNIDIIQTDIFPISITGKINTNIKYTKLDDNNIIQIPTAIKKYMNINDFLNAELFK